MGFDMSHLLAGDGGVIRSLDITELPFAVEVIKRSFATVAKDFGLTEQNCPRNTSFATTVERLERFYNSGALMYGIYEEECLAGYVALSRKDGDVFEIHNLSVLPEYRHRGYGKQLLDFCVDKVKELKGNKIVLSIIDENIVLKNWYIVNGFVQTDTKRFEFFPFLVGYMELIV